MIKFFKISLFIYFVFGSFLCYAQEGTVKWSVGTNGGIDEPIALGLDGNVYFIDMEQDLYAYHSNGTSYWTLSQGAETDPVVGSDSSIYAGYTYNMFSYYPNGTLQWSTTIYSSPFNGAACISIGPDNTVYVGGYDSTLRAFTPQGVQKWVIKLKQSTIAPTCINRTYGTIYVSAETPLSYQVYTTTFYAINSDSSIAWQISTSGYFGAASLDSYGFIYVDYTVSGLTTGNVCCLNPNGTVKWSSSKTNGWVTSTPVFGEDGTIYVGSWDSTFYALNSNGTLKWQYLTGGIINESAVIGNDSVIYFGSNDHYLYAFNPDSTLRWKLLFPGPEAAIQTTPVIDSTGTLYVGTSASAFYAVYCSSTGLANSAWPRAGHDNQNTGLSGPLISSTPLFPDDLFP